MTSMHQTLTEIDLNTSPRVLLLGNGLNRAYEGFSWSDMIAGLGYREFSLRERRAIASLPYPLQTVIATVAMRQMRIVFRIRSRLPAP